MIEFYMSECCGGVFVPGYGPDNIHESNDPNFHSERHGECPACGAQDPKLDEVARTFAEESGGVLGGLF